MLNRVVCCVHGEKCVILYRHTGLHNWILLGRLCILFYMKEMRREACIIRVVIIPYTGYVCGDDAAGVL